MNGNLRRKLARLYRYIGPHMILAVMFFYVWGDGARAIDGDTSFYPPLMNAVLLACASFVLGAIHLAFRSFSLWHSLVAYLVTCMVGIFVGLLFGVIATATVAVTSWPIAFHKLIAIGIWSVGIGMLLTATSYHLLPLHSRDDSIKTGESAA